MGQRTDPEFHREALAIAQRRTEVAELYLRGHTQAAIAERYGLDRGTISRDLSAVQDEWAESRVRDLDKLKTRELARVDQLERSAWTAWERSTRPRERNKVGHRGATKIVERTTEDRDGDPRFLAVIGQCIERRCKMLGLDAPLKVAQTDAEGNDIITAEQARYEYLAVLAVLRDRAREAAAVEGPGGLEQPNAGQQPDGVQGRVDD